MKILNWEKNQNYIEFLQKKVINMKIEKLAVIVKLDNEKTYQVALNNEQIDYLINDLQMLYFTKNTIKLLPTELNIDIINISNGCLTTK